MAMLRRAMATGATDSRQALQIRPSFPSRPARCGGLRIDIDATPAPIHCGNLPQPGARPRR
ncbi:hypothetical protein LC55x_4739 [Lysobacter capsici]|nr:hypothetical protein LC55x_4739 [Lysobacter capsici]